MKRQAGGTRFCDIRHVAETASTNADLLAQAREGAPEGIVLVADHQTAGRGRSDRVWTAPAGSSLLVSVLLRPEPARATRSTLAMAAAVVDAVEEQAGISPRIKWPNDIVWPGRGDAADRKLGGILAEADWGGSGSLAVVVGLGLNVNWPPSFPDELRAVATSLNHITGRTHDRDALLAAILRALDRWYDHGALVDAVRARSATIGSRVRVHLATGEVEGRADEITDDGHLLVVTDSGAVHEVSAGDVVHARPA